MYFACAFIHSTFEMDDDGDILRPKKKIKPTEENINSTEDLRLPPDNELNVHCAGSLDLDFINSLSEENRRRFFLSTRKSIPAEFIKEKLDMFSPGYDSDVLVVLQTLAKCFIGQTIEEIRKKRNFKPGPIKRSDMVVSDLPSRQTAL